MAFSDLYDKQVRLLMRVLPYVAEESCFALIRGDGNQFVYPGLTALVCGYRSDLSARGRAGKVAV